MLPLQLRCVRFVVILVISLSVLLPARADNGQRGMAWSLGYDPATLDPAKVDDEASEMVRYLSGGVLLRINRQTQAVEPGLAEAWRISPDGRTVTFALRPGLSFSDGSPLDAADVVFTLRRVLVPETKAPVAEEFLDPQGVTIVSPNPATVVVHLPRRLVEIERIFDEIAIEPRNRPSQGRVTAGPFYVAEYKRGQYVQLARNPHYWKRDAAGAALPYLPSLRLDVIANPEQERIRFMRGDYQVLTHVPPESFAALARSLPQSAYDLGPSLNTEQLWFNQAPGAPLPAFEKAWFQNQAFRVAISRAIHRADLARLAYAGHATPAYGFISPANHVWYDAQAQAPHEDAAAAQQLLAGAGFRRVQSGGKTILMDGAGHAVRFSILTNAGNAPRQRMATLLQQDLTVLGIEVTVVTLDFPALIERLLHTQDYEACLLGLANVDPDPNAMMNLWLSSSPNHQWNPSEKTPATPWEASIDRAMNEQASAPSQAQRVRAISQVESIVSSEQPFIYLVHPNTLCAVSPALTGWKLNVFEPGTVWNIESLRWAGSKP